MSEPEVLHEWGDGIQLIKMTSGSPWLLHKDRAHGEIFDEALSELSRLAARCRALEEAANDLIGSASGLTVQYADFERLKRLARAD